MRKVILLTALLSCITTTTIFAGEWKRDNVGWWYQNDNGGYFKSSWNNISEKWYYFDDLGYMAESRWIGDYYVGSDGVMFANTTTPDGYKVGVDGKRIYNANSTVTNSTAAANTTTAAITNNNQRVSTHLRDVSETAFEGYTHIVNLRSKKIHRPDCKELKKMKEKNKRYTNNINSLLEQGCEGCEVCNPR